MSKPDIHIGPTNPDIHIESQGFYLATAIRNHDHYRMLVRAGMASKKDEEMYAVSRDNLTAWVSDRLTAVYTKIHAYPSEVRDRVSTRALARLYEYSRMFHFPVDKNPADWNLTGFLRKFQVDGLDPALTYLLCDREMEGVIGGFLTELLQEQ